MGGIRAKTKSMTKRRVRRKAERRQRYHTNLGIPPAANKLRRELAKAE